MSLDDRPANCQTHAHAVGFGGEEYVEDPLDIVRVNPCPVIFNRKTNGRRLREPPPAAKETADRLT